MGDKAPVLSDQELVAEAKRFVSMLSDSPQKSEGGNLGGSAGEVDELDALLDGFGVEDYR